MKHLRKTLFSMLVFTITAVTFLSSFTCTANAAFNPYNSFVRVIGLSGQTWFGYAQDMYKPAGVISSSEFEKPEHICLHNDKLYIADSRLHAVVVVTTDGEYIETIGEDVLYEPTGVYVDDNFIYVADYGSSAVYKFSITDGSVVMKYERPQNPLFGKNEKFKPMKIVADKGGNIYVISEGGTSGAAQINELGEFLGFYGVNMSDVSLKMIMQRMFFTQSQREQLLSVKPPSPDTITIDSNGLIYTLTKKAASERIKKLNIAGKNVLTDSFSFDDTVDIAVDGDGNIFYVTTTGFGFFDSFGRLVNANFANDNTKEIAGLFRQPSSIAVDDNKVIYIADMDKGQIVKLAPTELASSVFKGIYYYKEGYYVDSMDIWEEVLSLNANFALAHNAMAKAYYKLGDYDRSLEEYMKSADRKGYSDSYWNVRNDWLQSNLGYIIILFVVLSVVLAILKEVDKRKNIYGFLRRFWGRVKETRVYREIIPLFMVLKHPIDTCDYIKRLKKVTYIGFFMMLGLLVITQLLFNYSLGYVFTYNFRDQFDVFTIIVMAIIPLFVFVIANYLVSTITDGEGSFKGVLIGTTVSFAPVILFALPVAIVTNFLTGNEAFLYSFAMFVLFGWSLINLFTVTMTIHDYTFIGAIKNILLTIVGMALIIIVVLATYVLFDQFVKFIINFR